MNQSALAVVTMCPLENRVIITNLHLVVIVIRECINPKTAKFLNDILTRR